MGCIFCKVAKKEVQAYIIYEDSTTMCFLPKQMEVEGHIILAPKGHYEIIDDVPEDILADMMSTLKKVTEILTAKLGADGFNVLHASGNAAQQGVNHFCFHVLPRYSDDSIDAWPDLPYLKLDKEDVYNKLTN
ncbi:MAG: hypothetical protein CFH44_00733 [Proteobacteria bacterium]|jgi:histidine triad (HIT) family protein|nr:MAG: hypothetical protein CFH44_00733 [Pseudomonadota bacterium]